jgi:hypothetical protein
MTAGTRRFEENNKISILGYYSIYENQEFQKTIKE